MGGQVCLSGVGRRWAEGLALGQENLGFLREAETQPEEGCPASGATVPCQPVQQARGRQKGVVGTAAGRRGNVSAVTPVASAGSGKVPRKTPRLDGYVQFP